MLLLNREDIKRVCSMRNAVDVARDALRIFSRGRCVIPLRTKINMPKFEGQCLIMPGYIEETAGAGIKIVSVFPKNIDKGLVSVPSKMILISGETGEVHAILEGTYLTQLRTGGVAGAATEILARKDAKIGALFGGGGQGAAQLEAMLTVRKMELIKIYDIRPGRAGEFAARMRDAFSSFDADIIAVDSPDEAVADADIITTATTSREPVFDGRKIKSGAHINALGSFMPQMREIDDEIVKRADKIFLDSREAVLAESGDLIVPIAQGTIGTNDITGELGDIVAGLLPGRERDDEITIFDSVGIAVLDIVTAQWIFKKASDLGFGVPIDF
jgi:ornithine cyclodeaminase